MSEDHQTVKITDFGLSRKTNVEGQYQPVGNTKLPFRWTAIECLGGESFSEKSDVWAFGIVLWEVFTRAPTPYADIKNTYDLETYLRQGNRLSHPGPSCPDELYEIMQSCWADEPANRPTFAQLYEIMQRVIDELDNSSEVDYSNVYLTPRASMNETANSAPTIMDTSDVNKFVHERNSTNGHLSIS